MTDPIETAVKTDVKSAESNLDARFKAYELETRTYVKAHIAWLIGAACLFSGLVIGYLIARHA